MPIRYSSTVDLATVTGITLGSGLTGRHRALTMDADYIWTIYEGQNAAGEFRGSDYICRFNRSTGAFLNSLLSDVSGSTVLSAYSDTFPGSGTSGGLIVGSKDTTTDGDVAYKLFEKDLSDSISDVRYFTISDKTSPGSPDPYDIIFYSSGNTHTVEVYLDFEDSSVSELVNLGEYVSRLLVSGNYNDTYNSRFNVFDFTSHHRKGSLAGDANNRFIAVGRDRVNSNLGDFSISVYDGSYSLLEGVSFPTTLVGGIVQGRGIADHYSVLAYHDSFLGVLDFARNSVDFYEYSATAFTPTPLSFFSDQNDLNLTVDELMSPVILPIATGGTGDLTYSVSALPSGLTFNAATRTISGTPTAIGTTTITYMVTDSALPAVEVTDSFDITIISGSFAFSATQAALTFTVNEAITSVVLPEAINGDGTVTYTLIDSGNVGLPPGLSFDPVSRTLSGTPTQVASWNMSYDAQDSATTPNTVGQSFFIHIQSAPDPPPDPEPQPMPPVIPPVSGDAVRQIEDLDDYAITVHFGTRTGTTYTVESTQAALIKSGTEFIRVSSIIDLRVELGLLEVVPYVTIPEIGTGDWIVFATAESIATPPTTIPTSAWVIAGVSHAGESHRQIFVCEYVEDTT